MDTFLVGTMQWNYCFNWCKIRNNAPLVNKYLYELDQHVKQFHIVAIKRGGTTIIPKGSDQILHNDILYFATLKNM